MKGSKSYGRFICGSLAVSFAVSPFLSLTVLADNISSANFDLRRQVVKLLRESWRFPASGADPRGDFAKMLVKASSYQENLPSSSVSVYADVPADHPNAVYIRVAASQGWMSGYLGGNFKPEEPVLYKDAVKAVLTLLGYTDEGFYRRDGQLQDFGKFNHLELNEDVSCQADGSDYGNGLHEYFYNLLKTKRRTATDIRNRAGLRAEFRWGDQSHFHTGGLGAKAPSWSIRISAWPSLYPLIRRMPMCF